jgi:putative acetyltransferase
MRVEDARTFLEVQRAAVRCIAAKDYAPDVIDAWAPIPVTEKQVEQVRSNQRANID